MSEPAQHHAINYIEFTTTDIALTKAFYEKAFAWNFQDYGPDYIGFDRVQCRYRRWLSQGRAAPGAV